MPILYEDDVDLFMEAWRDAMEGEPWSDGYIIWPENQGEVDPASERVALVVETVWDTWPDGRTAAAYYGGVSRLWDPPHIELQRGHFNT